MAVPLLDLKAQYPPLKDEVEAAFSEINASQYFINGPAVAECEAAVAAYCGSKFAVGVSSGTDALMAALMSLNIGRPPTDNAPAPEVITTAYSFFATAGSIWRAGAVPVFVDIEAASFNLDPAKLADAITERTAAIMPVHLYGQVAAMDGILKIAQKHDLPVIEDAAQAIGASQNGKRAGTFGRAGCFSFFPSKNLGGFGDGGMVTTDDEALAARLQECRNHGMMPKYYHKWVGANFRLDTLQAAVIKIKLKHLESWHAARQANAAYYDAAFSEISEVRCPQIAPENTSIYNQYVIRAPKRDALVEFLKSRQIGVEIYYPLALHQQECFKELGYQAGQMPVAEAAAASSLALPVYPELKRAQQDAVIDAVREFFAR